MKKIFITYPLALQLKEMGFDEECVAYFNRDDIQNPVLIISHSLSQKDCEINTGGILAPTWQQAIEFYTNTYGLECNVLPYCDNSMPKKYFFSIDRFENNTFSKEEYNCISKNQRLFFDDRNTAQARCLKMIHKIIVNSKSKVTI